MKLEKAHSSLLNEQNKKKHVETCNVGLTSDLIDESLSMPIIVGPTNPSCSTSTSILSSSDGFTCDASLMVENETLKKEVNKVTHTLAKATKVQTYDDGSDEEHDNENDSDSDDDEPIKDELFDMLEDAK